MYMFVKTMSCGMYINMEKLNSFCYHVEKGDNL